MIHAVSLEEAVLAGMVRDDDVPMFLAEIDGFENCLHRNVHPRRQLFRSLTGANAILLVFRGDGVAVGNFRTNARALDERLPVQRPGAGFQVLVWLRGLHIFSVACRARALQVRPSNYEPGPLMWLTISHPFRMSVNDDRRRSTP